MDHSTQPTLFNHTANDYHCLPASEKQMTFARHIAAEHDLRLPDDVLSDRRKVSAWIDAHKPKPRPAPSRFSNYPSSRQVAFAERIARIKRREVPRECFQDRKLMSRWIDGNM